MENNIKKVVNHAGIIQYKWIVRNYNELSEYIELVASNKITNRIINWIHNPDSDRQIEQIYHIKKLPVIQLAGVMIAELFNSTEKLIYQGNILVFNEANGYCCWDDKCMQILDWQNIQPKKEIVVIENASIIDSDVKGYLKKNNIQDYLSLTELYSFSKEEIFYYLSSCKKIIFKTQYVDKAQIDGLIKLASQIEPKEIVIINSPNFPATGISIQ